MKAKVSYQEFLESIDPLQAEVITYLDSLFIGQTGVNRKMCYRVPFYDYNKWFCYLNPIGKEEIEICFLDGQLMAEQFSELDTKGRKMVSGLKLSVKEDLPQILILDLLKYAISLKT